MEPFYHSFLWNYWTQALDTWHAALPRSSILRFPISDLYNPFFLITDLVLIFTFMVQYGTFPHNLLRKNWTQALDICRQPYLGVPYCAFQFHLSTTTTSRHVLKHISGPYIGGILSERQLTRRIFY